MVSPRAIISDYVEVNLRHNYQFWYCGYFFHQCFHSFMINIIIIPGELVPIAFIYTIPIIIMPVWFISSITNSTVIIWTVILIKLKKMCKMIITATKIITSTRSTSVGTITLNVIIIITTYPMYNQRNYHYYQENSDSNRTGKKNAWTKIDATVIKTAFCIKNKSKGKKILYETTAIIERKL